MSGIPHIYDTPYFFAMYEIDNEEDIDEQITDVEYEELIEIIKEHIQNEKIMKERIKSLEEYNEKRGF